MLLPEYIVNVSNWESCMGLTPVFTLVENQVTSGLFVFMSLSIINGNQFVERQVNPASPFFYSCHIMDYSVISVNVAIS